MSNRNEWFEDVQRRAHVWEDHEETRPHYVKQCWKVAGILAIPLVIFAGAGVWSWVWILCGVICTVLIGGYFGRVQKKGLSNEGDHSI